MADDKPIIIIKKKGGHGGHHGGAWKVAYADFVTAMMAFFMVMWLLNSSESKTRVAIASYFRRPGLFESGSGTPILIGGAGILPDAYQPPRPYEEVSQSSGADPAAGAGKGREGENKGAFVSPKTDQDLTSDGLIEAEDMHQGVEVESAKEGGAIELVEKLMAQRKKMEQVAQGLETALREVPELKELLGLVEVDVSADGLTIEIMDTDKASMFRSGSSQIMPGSTAPFEKIATLLKTLPNQIEIMGHTDAKPFASKGGMSNWELSADRANAARRLLESQGIPADRIVSVTGRAERELRYPSDPFNPSNRRISLKVKFDLEKLQAAGKEGQEAFKEFNKYLPPTAIATSSPATKAATATTQGTQTNKQEQEIIDQKADNSTPKKKAERGPKLEIRSPDAKRGITLPPEKNETPADRKQEEPTIFMDDPVIGPRSPVFGF
jgi:chemotaxis protein MotB